MHRKSVLALATLIMALAVVIACSGDSASNETPAPSATVGTVSGVTPTTSASSGEPCCPLLSLEDAAKTWPTMVFDVTPSSFQEAPMLAEKVTAGELPPLSERLPKDYAVIQPGYGETGKYGGTWKSVYTGPADEQNVERITHNHLLYWTADYSQITPSIFKGFDASDDNKQFTFHMREGMKWSDGEPLTADDVMFWYNDILLNDDLVPAKFAWATVGGELGVWAKVDDYTFTVTFSQPYGLFPDQVAGLSVGSNFNRGEMCGGMISPKHYMSQFHATYIGLDAANELARSEGFDNWSQMFCNKNNPIKNPEAPSTSAWVPVTGFNTQQAVFERNPYYWAVDTDGNQLPYIDRITFDLVQDLEVLNLRAIAGDFTIQNRHMDVNKLPVFIENQEKGNYRVVLDKSPISGGSQTGIAFNQDWDGDPELASFIQNADFRRALSMSVDRDQINETFFLGQARPASTCAYPDPPYAPGPEYDQIYSTLEVDKANDMLDELGLDNRDSDGYRTLPSGNRLELRVMVVGGTFQDWPGQLEMIANQWKENVGIRLTVETVDRTLREQRLRANDDVMLSVWGVNGSSGLWLFPENSFAWDWQSMMGPLSGQWLASGGEIGTEPTGLVRRQQELYEQALQASPEDRIALGQEIHRIRCEQVYYIGTVTGGGLGSLWIINNDVAQLPQGIIGSVSGQNPGNVWPETWYFKSGQEGASAN